MTESTLTDREFEILERVHALRLERGLRHIDCARALGLGTREAFRVRARFSRDELAKLSGLFGLSFAEAFPMYEDHS